MALSRGEVSPGPSTNGSTAAANRDLSDLDILTRARQAANGRRFERLWNGDTTDYDSHSEADLALCRLLAFWTGPDPERIERMFSESRLAREKWRKRPSYRGTPLAKALEGMTEFYHAPSDATLIIGRKKGEASGPEVEASLRSSSFSKAPSPLPEAPPFPVEALPDAARAFVEGAAEAIGCAVDLIAAPVLGGPLGGYRGKPRRGDQEELARGGHALRRRGSRARGQEDPGGQRSQAPGDAPPGREEERVQGQEGGVRSASSASGRPHARGPARRARPSRPLPQSPRWRGSTPTTPPSRPWS